MTIETIIGLGVIGWVLVALVGVSRGDDGSTKLAKEMIAVIKSMVKPQAQD